MFQSLQIFICRLSALFFFPLCPPYHHRRLDCEKLKKELRVYRVLSLSLSLHLSHFKPPPSCQAVAIERMKILMKDGRLWRAAAGDTAGVGGAEVEPRWRGDAVEVGAGRQAAERA